MQNFYDVPTSRKEGYIAHNFVFTLLARSISLFVCQPLHTSYQNKP